METICSFSFKLSKGESASKTVAKLPKLTVWTEMWLRLRPAHVLYALWLDSSGLSQQAFVNPNLSYTNSTSVGLP